LSRSFPDYRPNGEEIKLHLNEAVRNGFSNAKAQELIDAWNRVK